MLTIGVLDIDVLSIALYYIVLHRHIRTLCCNHTAISGHRLVNTYVSLSAHRAAITYIAISAHGVAIAYTAIFAHKSRRSTHVVVLRQCDQPPIHPSQISISSCQPPLHGFKIKNIGFHDWTTIGNTNFARPQQPGCGCSTMSGYGCVVATQCADVAMNTM